MRAVSLRYINLENRENIKMRQYEMFELSFEGPQPEESEALTDIQQNLPVVRIPGR